MPAHTLRVQFVISAPIAFALPAGAADRMRGLEVREARLEWELAHDAIGRPGKRATRACQVFAGHAVLSTDGGEMGVVLFGVSEGTHSTCGVTRR